MRWVKKTYQKGVKLTRKEMDALEKRFERLPGLQVVRENRTCPVGTFGIIIFLETPKVL